MPAPADPAAWGITDGYQDIAGAWHATTPSTAAALLRAMRADAPEPPDRDAVRVVRAGAAVALDGPAEIDTEDGARLLVAGALPPDLPLGYHRLTGLDDGHVTRLIVGPGRCHLPPGLRAWGWAVQLPTVRSAASWGMGDLGDAAELARWSGAELGAGTMLLNPLHAARPVLPQQPSPYYPSSRRYRSPLYLRLEAVPGWSDDVADLAELAVAGRALSARRIVDRDAVWRLKTAALERLWPAFVGDARFDAYVEAEGDALLGYATFCVLDEERCRKGVPDAPLPHPTSAEVTALRRDRRGRIRFHQWVQWLLDVQLAAAGRHVGLMQDLAVGFDPQGADAWQYQDIVTVGVRVGAPPDEFNTAGQDWGLPPLDPWRLRASAYRPFIETIRNGFRHAGGLRVDHVMGLFRLYWIPPDAGPADGAYVRYPWADLLEILALESVRAGAYVVGEDLGTVEDIVRRELAGRDVLSYRLLWFEDGPPSAFPERALSAVTTHDLPTVAGLWTGSDLDDQRAAGVQPNEESTVALRDQLRAATGLADDAPIDDVVAGAHALLAQTPSAVVCATLEDALAVEARPNLPGTTDEVRPNWSIALPSSLEEIEVDPRARRLAGLLRRDAGTLPPC